MSRRIDNIANRIVSLAAKQPAPRLVLILDDGSKRNVFGGLPESLVHLQLPDGRCVASIEKPTGMDDDLSAVMIYQPFCMTGLRISQPDVQRWISRQRRIKPRKGLPSLHNGQNATTI